MLSKIFNSDSEKNNLIDELQKQIQNLTENFSSNNAMLRELQNKVAELENKNLPIKSVCNETKIVSAKSSDQKLFVIQNNIETKMSVEEIFGDNNFTDLKIVTYKISPDFFNDVVKKFQTATLLIGEKDFNENFDAELFQNPNIEIKITKSELVHDKIFLLSNAEKNFCRVVTGSANFTKAAFGKNFETKNNFETIRVDDSEELYNLYLQRFNFLFQQSEEYSFKPLLTEINSQDLTVAEEKFSERKTGFKFLDDKQSFYPGLYVLGGAPGVGKTTFVWQLLNQLAENGEDCIFCSYEILEDDLKNKIKSRKNFLQITSQEKISEKKFKLKFLKLTTEKIDDLLEILKNVCNDLKRPPIVAIDYLQIIPSKIKFINDGARLAVDNILQKIKQFQLETETTFILISSFTKGTYDIKFDSFKESSGIGYTADVVWGLKLKYQEQEKKPVLKEIKIVSRQVEFEIEMYAEQPSAKFKTYVPDKVYYRVKDTAKNFGGDYNKDAKQFLFSTVENRDAFVKTLTKYYEEIEQTKKLPMRQMYLCCLKNRQGKNYDACFNFYPEFAYFESVENFPKDEQKNSDEEN